jgi:tetratricopeptide (TPR) repeat protein
MRISVFVALVAGPLMLAGSALAFSQRDWDECQASDLDRRIAGCSGIIDDRGATGKSRAVAFNNRGLAYRHKGDLDRAIADYNEAIGLDGKYEPAYYNRGEAYRAKGDTDRAIVDYTEAIRLDANDADPLIARGIAYRVKGDSERAIADLNEAIRLNPKIDSAYFNRGIVYLYSGSLSQALADVTRASELDPKDAYAALWVEIVGQRSKAPSRLAQASAALDMAAWPAPVIRMFLGQMTPAAVLAAADDRRRAGKRAKCARPISTAANWRCGRA